MFHVPDFKEIAAKKSSKTSDGRRIRVLLIAEMANPEWASVPLIGWQNAVHLRDVAEVHLVTQIRNKDAIEKAGWKNSIDFTAIDSEAFARPAVKIAGWLGAANGKGWTIHTALSSLSYYYFEHLVWKTFGSRIKGSEYDIVHRVTPVSPTSQSPLAAKCARYGIPMIIGPLNGGVEWPAQFDSSRRAEREWLSYVRNAYKLLPAYRSTLKHAARLLVGSKATLIKIPKQHLGKCIYMPENGVDSERFSLSPKTWDGNVLDVIFVGRLVPYKGPDMVIDALTPFLKSGRAKLSIVGDGPMNNHLRLIVTEREITNQVAFHGWVDHKQISVLYSEANVLCFPSIREFGGGVVLEAMAEGVVPIVVDYAGPGELVTDDTGYKIPLADRSRIILHLQDVIQKIITNPKALAEKSINAVAEVRQHYTWQAKSKVMYAIYKDVMTKMPMNSSH